MDQKIVLLHGFTREETIAAMKAIKAAVSGADDAAFATSTPTNLGWKLKDIVEHVSEEHRAFKATAARPSFVPHGHLAE